MSRSTDLISTSFMILRKTPYSETSIVVAGITPKNGQLHFLVRGGRRLGRRAFPLVDLFRILEIQFSLGRGGLTTWRDATVERDFSSLAQCRTTYETASWLAQFSLGNSLEGISLPRFFTAFTIALERLCRAAGHEGERAALHCVAVAGPCLVFLDEQGLLPDYAGSDGPARQARHLLRIGAEAVAVPALPGGGWDRLRDWSVALLRYTGCHVPDEPWLRG